MELYFLLILKTIKENVLLMDSNSPPTVWEKSVWLKRGTVRCWMSFWFFLMIVLTADRRFKQNDWRLCWCRLQTSLFTLSICLLRTTRCLGGRSEVHAGNQSRGNKVRNRTACRATPLSSLWFFFLFIYFLFFKNKLNI